MSRTDLLDLLALLRALGRLTTAQAAAVLAAFDRGALPGDSLPLPPAEITLALSPALASAALADAVRAERWGAASLRLPYRVAGSPPAALRLGSAGRERLGRELLEVFAREADRRTALLFAPPDADAADRLSRGSLRRWHVAMRQAVAEDLVALAQLGAGRPLTPAELARLEASAAAQHERLARFAGEVAARRAAAAEGVGTAMSEAEVAARARMYSGEALSELYRFAEGEPREGYVADYVALDGGGTCGPCLEAQAGSPYLVGQGPMPGAHTCLGRGHCRCRRVQRWAPTEYDRLTNAAAAVAA